MVIILSDKFYVFFFLQALQATAPANDMKSLFVTLQELLVSWRCCLMCTWYPVFLHLSLFSCIHVTGQSTKSPVGGPPGKRELFCV